MSDGRVAIFAQHKPRLTALAYRMLGAMGEAEDAVQDTYLRWHRAAGDDIRAPAAWLTSVCARLCIDRLRAAKSERERYVGPWLPEPVVTEPGDPVELAESLAMAFLVVLERLGPVERAAYLLREAFDYEFAEIAGLLGKSEATCRQLVARAGNRLKAERPRFSASADAASNLAQRFAAAAAAGDAKGFAALLAADARLWSDGGGKVAAARHVIAGADRVARFFIGVAGKQPPNQIVRFRVVNGQPGIVGYVAGQARFALALDVVGGHIRNVFVVNNPEKLRRLPRLAGGS
jgi:RNA polymerase sigma-70 factor (ECF subfamily)